ncbi:MAG TPA: DUF1761 domain-containing protein [Vitreimonas sp.]|nr:DUF1761 domain-containing protein [Vitreimonas sp.]
MFETYSLVMAFVAALASFTVGMVWYSPVLFGNMWMKLMKVTAKDMAKAKARGMAGIMGSSFAATLLQALILVWFSQTFLMGGVRPTAMFAFLAWLGFIVPTQITQVIYENKSWSLFFLSTGYQVAQLLAMAVVIGMMR